MNIYVLVSAGFLIAYLVIGIYVSRSTKTPDDFYVMSRQAPPYLITGTVVATALSSVTIIGYAGSSFSNGPLPYISFFGGALITGVVVGLSFGPRLRRLGSYTVPDFFAERFPSTGIRIMSSIIVLFTMSLYLIVVLNGTGIALDGLLGWPNAVGIVVSLALISTFTFVGGMRGVVVTDTVMFGVFFIATLAIVPFIFSAAGGWPDAISRAAEQLPRVANLSGTMSAFSATAFYIETFVLGIVLWGAAPHLISRAYIARDEKTLAQGYIWAVLLSPIFVFVVLFSFGLTPLFAPQDIEGANVFAWVARNLVPTLIGALALAGVVAAALSSASSLLQQAAAAASRDIYQRFISPESSSARFLLVSRISVVLIAIIAGIVAVASSPTAGAIVYGFLLASAGWAAWAPALAAGVFWRKATTSGVFSSMISGFISALIVGFGREFGYTPSWLPPNLVGLVVATVVLIAVSLASSSPPDPRGLEALETMRRPTED